MSDTQGTKILNRLAEMQERPLDAVAFWQKKLTTATDQGELEIARSRLTEESRDAAIEAMALSAFLKTTDRLGVKRSTLVEVAADRYHTKLAKVEAQRHPALTSEQRYVKALDTEEGSEAYRIAVRYRGQTVAELLGVCEELMTSARAGVEALERAG